MLGSFLALYAVLTLFGTSLIYKDIEATGCDPSAGVQTNVTCESSGPDVFGAMLGVAFSGQGISQVGNFVEALSAARVAVYECLKAIRREPGAEEEIIYKTEEDDELNATTHSKNSNSEFTKKKSSSFSFRKSNTDMEAPEKVVKAILPKYEIDSSSEAGLKPKDIKGAFSFKDVQFTYPSRPNELVLKGVSLEIEAGKTIAFVGPSGSGKSTIVAMLERFYDPNSGGIELDGVNLKDLNVAHLRSNIGYVGQVCIHTVSSRRGCTVCS